ncbi:MAG: 16S rRNA (guanine(966)-N(2))-methyltransferase RsmD [Bacillales bacterium]|nr:16S rRNA (guanine(966)-N(2))-methyltransferase RsmD [Bacillales bacterium]
MLKGNISMRVIAGVYRSRLLKAVIDDNTRPTTDKNKEMVFNSLGQFFNGGIVLDLFAGTGSLGIEALSRGMKYGYFCELSPNTYECLKDNIKNLKIENATTYNGDFKAFLKKYDNIKFDLVLLDPPYKISEELPGIVKYLLIKDMLKKDALMVLETPRDMEFIPEGFDVIKNKFGAASRFVILKYKGERK